MINHFRVLGSVSAMLALLSLTGCIETKEEGQTMVWKFEMWLPALIIIAGIAALVGSVMLLRSKSWTWGIVCLVGGIFGALLMGPGMVIDRVKVAEDHFDLDVGLWFMRTQHTVKFADLAAIDITSETTRSRRGKRTSYYLVCHQKDGQSKKVPVGTLMEEAVGDIFALAKHHNIPVNDRTGGE